MNKFSLLLLLVVTFSSLVAAQSTNDDKGFEVFAGYSFTAIDDQRSSQPIDHVGGLDGVNVAATGYVTKRFGITADFSAGFHSGTEQVPGGTLRFKSRSFNYMAGPHFRFSNKTRFTPFVHTLAGVSNNRFNFRFTPSGPTASATAASEKATDFAMALGGGLDIRAAKRFSVRLFQIDYNPVFARDRSAFGTVSGSRFDNVRFSIGVVFRK